MYVPPQAVPCVNISCTESGVSLALAGLANQVHVICLNCLKSKMNKPGNIADCAVLLENHGMYAVVELKGAQDRSKVEMQVRGGLDIIDEITPDQHLQDFFPIFIYSGRDPTAAFRGMKFKMRGLTRRIIPWRSDSQLLDILRASRRDITF